MKNKKGNRYTPPKPKPKVKWSTPWWLRRAYRKSGNKVEYFWRVVDFLENGNIDESLVLRVKNNRTRWHI